MEVFINELSIHEQYDSIDAFTESVIEFTKITSKLRNKKYLDNFYKKSDFYYYRQAIYNEYFTVSMDKIKDKSIATFFKEIVFNKSNPKDWQKNRFHNVQDNYYSNTLNIEVAGQTLAEITERKIKNEDKVFLLLNFKNSNFSDGVTTSVVKNKSKDVNIDCVENIQQVN